MGTPTQIGSFVSTLNVLTSGAIALSAGASVGDVLVVSVVGGSASIGAGISDSKSNTWTPISQGIAASGAAGTATGFVAPVTVALTTADTITVTRTPTGSLTVHVWLLSGQNSAAPIGNAGTTPTANSVTAVTAMPSGSVTVVPGDVVFQITMMGTGYGTVTPLASPAFTTLVTVDSTGGSNPRGTNVEYRVITAGSTFTPQITVSSGKAYSAVAVVIAALAAPAPGTVAGVAAVPGPAVIVGGNATATPATVAGVAAVPAVVVSTFRRPSLTEIGDSLTYRSGNDANPPSRETATRAVMATAGFESGAFYWWGVGGKSLVASDASGKTTLQNITDAVAVLGTPIDYVVIALGTNNTADPDATLAANVDTVLDALNGVATRVIWIGLAFFGVSNTNAVRMNPIISARVALRPYATFYDFNTYIHSAGVYDANDWLATFGGDSTHMTTQGWPKRDAYIAAQLQAAQAVGTVAAVAGVGTPAGYQVTVATVAGVTVIPTVTPASSPTPATVAGVAAVPAVAFSSSVTRAPATVVGITAVPAPTVALPATVVPATVAGVAAVPAPSAVGSTLTTATVAGITAVPAPVVRASSTTGPATVAGVAAVPAVTVVTVAGPVPATVAAVAAVPPAGQITTTPAVAPARTGSWGTLLAILDEVRDIARQEATRVPVACPNDGTPLLSGPRGGLYCPWGDYQHGMAHPPG